MAAIPYYRNRVIMKNKPYVDFKIEWGGEMGQPDWNFGPSYKKYTLVASEHAFELKLFIYA